MLPSTSRGSSNRNITFYLLLISYILVFPVQTSRHVNSPLAPLQSSRHRRFISDTMRMPGTKWCGKGWRADRFEELGAYSGADKCCRQHDLGCPVSIGPLESKFGLFNWRLYPAMHCTCDERFRSCLKLTNSASANVVGSMFFNVIGTPCFMFSPRRVCTERTWWGRCLSTELQQQAVWRAPMTY